MPNDNTFHISIFNSVTDTTPQAKTSDFLINLIHKPTIGSVKTKNQVFNSVKFDGTRKNEMAVEVYALVLDYDTKENSSKKVYFDEEINFLKTLGFTFYAYTTHSHTNENNCFRVVIPLKEPIPKELFSNLWNWIYKQTREKIDTQCKDISRAYYLPRHKKDAPYKSLVFEGNLLDWQQLPLNQFNKNQSTENNNNHQQNEQTTHTELKDYIWKYINKLPESIEGCHGHNDLMRCAYYLIQGFGLSEIEAFPYFVKWNKEKANPPESLGQLEHKLSDALKPLPPEGKSRGWLQNDYEKNKKTKAKALQFDDSDFATIFAEDYPNYKYDFENLIWRKWNGVYWVEGNLIEEIKEIVMFIIKNTSSTKTSSRLVASVINLAQSKARKAFNNNHRLINFINGTLEIDTNIFRNHDMNDGLCECLPYEYKKYSPNSCPKTIQFLTSTFQDDKAIEAFMSHAGLSLMKDKKMHNALVIIGATRSGKTTALALLNLLCGATINDAFSFAGTTLFDRGSEGKRTRAIWNNRLFVGIDELPIEAFSNEETLKCLIAHSGTEMRALFKDEKIGNRWQPKLAFAANSKPTLKDGSGALMQRLLVLKAPYQRNSKDQDKYLLESLLSELGTFAYLCLEYAKKTLKNKQYPISRAMQMNLEEITLTSNPLKLFIHDYCVLDQNAVISVGNLFDVYKSFCEDQEIKYLIPKNRFSSHLTDMHPQQTKADKFKGERAIYGIRLKTSEEKLIEAKADTNTLDSVDNVRTMQEVHCPILTNNNTNALSEIWTIGRLNQENLSIEELTGYACYDDMVMAYEKEKAQDSIDKDKNAEITVPLSNIEKKSSQIIESSVDTYTQNLDSAKNQLSNHCPNSSVHCPKDNSDKISAGYFNVKAQPSKIKWSGKD